MDWVVELQKVINMQKVKGRQEGFCFRVIHINKWICIHLPLEVKNMKCSLF